MQEVFPIMDAAAGDEQGACVACRERCQREHRAAGGGGQFESPALRPSFLRTVLEHNVRHNMAIPKAFVRMHGKSLPGSTVDLEGANGKVWLVTVGISSTGTAVFRFGWHVFALDNNLKLGDAILFTMVARNRFTVRVFTKNGLEPLNPTNANISHDSLAQTPHSVGGATHLADSDDDFTRSGSENGGEPEFRGGHGPTIQQIINNARAYPAGEDSVRHRGSGKPRRPKRHRRSPDARQSHHVEVLGANSTLFASRRRIVTNVERERAMEQSRQLLATLSLPCFTVVMMPSHVYRGFWLNIPNEFSRQHLPYNRMRIILRDTLGEDWGAQWIRDDDDHHGLSGGWAAFSKDHGLEEGDVCVFELQDSESFIFLVHMCRVVEVPSVPIRRGPAGWEVTYNVIYPDLHSHPLPDLNEGVKSEPDATPRAKRSHLADVLQEMIRSGKFSNLRREEYEALPNKIRALAENGTGDVDEDVKPDVEPFSSEIMPVSSQYKRPNSPFHFARDVSVKSEPEDVHSMSSLPAGQPSYTAPNGRPGDFQVKAEPMYIVKTEDVSTTEISQLAVYSRRRRKQGSSSVANSVSTEGEVDRVWYPVIRLLGKRQSGNGQAEKEVLVELLGTVPESERSRFEQGPDGAVWVPSSHFSSDWSACFLRP